MKILVAGDYCPINRVAEKINEGDFQMVLGDIRNVIKEVDYSVVNLECPVSESKNNAIDKCGPNLSCTRKGVEALKWAGFNCVTLANNHFLDYGESGVEETLTACREIGLSVVGGGKNLKEASGVLYINIGGKYIALINCCEYEFSIATETSSGSNPLNIVRQYYAIQEAKKKAAYVIVIVHGGVELFWLPSQRMIETYRFFIDAGADTVINHHQHCYSGFETYKGKPIFYGLGNFCFDKETADYRWTSGYMVVLEYDGTVDCIKFDIIPYRQCSEDASVRILKGGRERENFNAKLNSYNEIIADDERRESEYKQWCLQKEGMYKLMLNPVNNRYLSWLFDGWMGKRLISKMKLLQMYDYLVNESHIERVRMLFNGEIIKR